MALNFFQNSFKPNKIYRLCFYTTNCSNISKSYSTTYAVKKDNPKIKKSVFISQSSDVFSNLALEEWLYRNFDFTNHHVLLMCRNSPCIVIGRNQNPWLESNNINTSKFNKEIARRSSNGSAVYNNGNINLTFFTPRDRFNRRENLEVVSRALFREYDIKSQVTNREEIVFHDNRTHISNTSLKIGARNAYHHFSVPVNDNEADLNHISYESFGISTRAIQSVQCSQTSVQELNKYATVEQLSEAIGWEYLRTCPVTFKDFGTDHIGHQNGFHLVNPTDGWFPGLEKIYDKLGSWEWRFGRTPEFTITRSFVIPEEVAEIDLPDQMLKIKLTVGNGIIQNVTMVIPPTLMFTQKIFDTSTVANLRGQRFTEGTAKMLDKILENWKALPRNKEFLVNCMKRVIMSA